jgi:hypothetical protein
MHTNQITEQDGQIEPISLQNLDYSIAPGGSQEPVLSPLEQMAIMIFTHLYPY